jgi:hypothetical protein
MPRKISFFQSFFLLFTVHFEGTFTSVFVGKKSKTSHKILEIKVYLTFLLVDRKKDPVPDPYKIMTDPEGPKT